MKGVHWVLLTALISGFSIFLNAFGVKVVNPSVFTTLKNSVVAIFLITIIIATTEITSLRSLSKKDWGKLALIGLIGGSIPFLLFFNGLSLLGGASASFVHKLMFLFVGIFAFFFLKEKLKKKTWLAAIAFLTGNALLLSFTSVPLNAGLFLVLGATLFWAAELTLSKHVLQSLAPRIVMLGRMGFGSVFLISYLAFTRQLDTMFSLNLSQFGWVLLTSLFLTGYVFTFYTGLKTTKVTLASMVLLLGSAITSLLQLFFLDKAFSVSQITGVVLLVAGVGYVLISEKAFNVGRYQKSAT